MKRFFQLSLFFLLPIIAMGQAEDDPTFTEYEDRVPGTIMVEFGFAYDSEYPEELELDWFRSRSFNLYYMYDFRLFGSDKLSLNPGFGLGTDNYAFRSKRFLVEGQDSLFGQVVALDSYEEFKDNNGNQPAMRHSKVNPIYIDIPLEIRYRTNSTKKSFRLALGGKVGIRVDNKSKVKYRADGQTQKIKIKNELHTELFRYGVYARVGFGSFNFWVYKSLSNLFISPSTEVIQGNFSPWVYGITLVTF